MRKRSLYPSEGQCSNSRNIDPAILPRPKFSNDWHPGTDHMPFAVARPPSRTGIDNPSRRLRIARPLYAVVEDRKHLFYYISFNRKCVFEFVPDICWHVAAHFSVERQWIAAHGRIRDGRVPYQFKSVMWETKYVPREKIDGMFPWIFRIFTRSTFTLYLLCEKIESDGIPLYLTRPHSSSILERI